MMTWIEGWLIYLFVETPVIAFLHFWNTAMHLIVYRSWPKWRS